MADLAAEGGSMNDTAGDLPRVLQLLWGLESPTRPGPKPGLSITGIGAAAVRIADAEGLGAVSMSKVAAELGFTTMSLYRYVSSKDDLYAVMVEEGFGRPELGDPGDAGWRDRITAWALAVRAAIHRHPWILQVPITEPPLSPKQLEWMEEGLRAFAGTPLTDRDRLSLIVLVNVYVRGNTQLTASVFSSRAAANLTGLEANRIYGRRLALLADPDRFPTIAGTLGSGTFEDDSDLGPDDFLFGLRTVLDGIELLIQRRTAQA
jgi:AcrR family transcriptional regulator